MNVVITGGTSGMGLAAVDLFIKNQHTVLILALEKERGEELVSTYHKKGFNNLYFYPTDVTKSEDIKFAYDYAKKNIGIIDSVVNNAGVFLPGELHTTTEENWDLIFNVDVKSILLTSKYFIPDMIKQQKGTIVNTASVSGMLGDYNMAAYNAAKGAVVNLARSMALDYGKYNVRVNNVCPAACATPMFLQNPPEVISEFNNASPLKRICTPEEVAKAMYFLATDDSSSCNGINLEVSGGMNVHTGQPIQ